MDTEQNTEDKLYEMNMKAQELYVLWDNALNDLWKDVESVLTEERVYELYEILK